MDKYKLVPVEPTASPTSGMNLGQRIQHVGGWESERGTVEFGSVMAVGALVSHILRDIAVQGEPVAWYLPSEAGYDSCFRDHATIQACTANPWTGWLPLYLHPQPAPGVSELVEALEEISDPIRFMQERLEEGEQLNGMAAVQLAEDASYLRGIAKAALAAHRKGGEL